MRAIDEIRQNMRRMNHVDDLVHRTDSPFITSINSHHLPSKFKMPSLNSYDGMRDPCYHIATFKTSMHLQGVPDETMCRALPTTLKGPARVWFSKIPSNTVSSFEELSKLFVKNLFEVKGINAPRPACWLWSKETMKVYNPSSLVSIRKP